MENQRTIKMTDFLYAVRKHRKLLALLLLAAFALGMGMTILSRCLDAAKKTSTITASFAVAAANSRGGYSANNPEPQSQDIYLAENMMDAVMYVCTSDAVLEAVAANLGLSGGSVRDIRANLRISQYKKTQIAELSLRWPDPDEGIRILTAMTETAPPVLVRTLGLGSVSVVNGAKASPAEGHWKLQYPAVAVTVGVAAGFVYVLCSLCIHPTLVNPSDARRLFGLETLAEIPFDSADTPELSGSEEAASAPYQNGIDSAAHSLLFRLPEECGVLLITSATPGEGKTKMAFSLGVQLARQGKRVLLVDGNWHHPDLSRMLMPSVQYKAIRNATGQKEIPAGNAMFSLTANLDFLPNQPTCGSENEHLGQVVDALKQDYDLVLIDAASVTQAADIMQMSRMADRVIFVIRHDMAWVDVIQSSLAKLRSADAEIVGTVINGVREYGSGENRRHKQEKP